MNTNIPLDSQDLIFRVLCYFIERAESGELDDIVAAGFSGEDISLLRQMTVADVVRLSATHGLVEVRVDTAKLERSQAALANQKIETEQFAYLAQAGAPATFLADLFRVTKEEAQTHLSILDIARPSGRPAMPDTTKRDQIHQWWADHQETPVRQRWIDLHKQWPLYTIATLYAVVNEFNL